MFQTFPLVNCRNLTIAFTNIIKILQSFIVSIEGYFGFAMQIYQIVFLILILFFFSKFEIMITTALKLTEDLGIVQTAS